MVILLKFNKSNGNRRHVWKSGRYAWYSWNSRWNGREKKPAKMRCLHMWRWEKIHGQHMHMIACVHARAYTLFRTWWIKSLLFHSVCLRFHCANVMNEHNVILANGQSLKATFWCICLLVILLFLLLLFLLSVLITAVQMITTVVVVLYSRLCHLLCRWLSLPKWKWLRCIWNIRAHT